MIVFKSSLFKGTSIGVYTLGFELVLSCIRVGGDYMTGSDSFSSFLPWTLFLSFSYLISVQIEENITEMVLVDSWRTTNSLCGFLSLLLLLLLFWL